MGEAPLQHIFTWPLVMINPHKALINTNFSSSLNLDSNKWRTSKLMDNLQIAQYKYQSIEIVINYQNHAWDQPCTFIYPLYDANMNRIQVLQCKVHVCILHASYADFDGRHNKALGRVETDGIAVQVRSSTRSSMMPRSQAQGHRW